MLFSLESDTPIPTRREPLRKFLAARLGLADPDTATWQQVFETASSAGQKEAVTSLVQERLDGQLPAF